MTNQNPSPAPEVEGRSCAIHGCWNMAVHHVMLRQDGNVANVALCREHHPQPASEVAKILKAVTESLRDADASE